MKKTALPTVISVLSMLITPLAIANKPASFYTPYAFTRTSPNDDTCHPNTDLCIDLKNISSETHYMNVQPQGQVTAAYKTYHNEINFNDTQASDIEVASHANMNLIAFYHGPAGVTLQFNKVGFYITNEKGQPHKKAYAIQCPFYTSGIITHGLIQFAINPDTRSCTVVGP